MKNKRLIIIVIFSLLVMLLSMGIVSSLAADKKVYINGIDPAFPPFCYIDEKGNPAGFDVESLDWVANQMGFNVKHLPLAWDGIIPNLLAGKIDLIYAGMGISKEREKVVDFTIPYWVINEVVCVLESSDLNIISALTGNYTVGSQRGTQAEIWLETNLIKPGILGKDKLKLYETFSLAVQDLVNGRIDSVMMDDVMAEDAIRKGKPIKIVGIIKTGYKYAAAVRKEDKELKALLNEGIAKLRKSDKWDELIVKYFTK